MRCDSPFWVLPKAATEKVPVPCGRCPPCKKRRVNSWVFRCMEEDKISSFSHFVTFTYDPKYVPITPNKFLTLCKKDFQDMMKRLRKLCPDSTLKYYACGEYGSRGGRPHYHAIIFNCPDERLFAEAWKVGTDPIGSVVVGQVSGDSVAYTMKYIDKPGKVPAHQRDDRVPEFALMSKGLGASYVNPATIAYHQADLGRLYVSKPGGFKIAMPKYYREKIYDDKQLKAQLPVIQAAVDVQVSDHFSDFLSMYMNPDGTLDYDYNAYLDSERQGRYRAFNKDQKSRDL